ncbi:MAG: FAD-dependent monooxygenase [Nitrospinae bacterium]|nr:FAD-dependent monooxygenase [Nitrospinota bacterium]
MTAWDVAVIGGGIAGSAAAALLAQGGLQVILLEKGAFPRHKVCGEFLSPDGGDLLERLGVWPQVQAVGPQRVEVFALSAGGRETRRPLPRPGWGVSRWTLDALLWQHAQAKGVVAWDRSTVVSVEGDFAQGFSLAIRRSDHAAQLIRAHAALWAAGRLRRPLRGAPAHPRRVWPRLVGLKAHFLGGQLDRCVALHTVPQGYCGVVGVEGGQLNLCCLTPADALRRVGGTPDSYLAYVLRESPSLRACLAGATPIEPRWKAVSFTYGEQPTPVEGGMWMIGDSAGMIAPLTGDGMGMGLRAAELAATTLLAAFRGDLRRVGATAEYARRWRQEFMPRLRWGRLLEAILLSPRLAALGCVALQLAPALLGLVYHRTRGITRAAALEIPCG